MTTDIAGKLRRAADAQWKLGNQERSQAMSAAARQVDEAAGDAILRGFSTETMKVLNAMWAVAFHMLCHAEASPGTA
jgi:hypothetical protein